MNRNRLTEEQYRRIYRRLVRRPFALTQAWDWTTLNYVFPEVTASIRRLHQLAVASGATVTPRNTVQF
jgi:hypothetical protein